MKDLRLMILIWRIWVVMVGVTSVGKHKRVLVIWLHWDLPNVGNIDISIETVN